ncbi:hypothetical protein ACFW2V_13675 [Streptomyces sp. NPDC058947]|uniref:hypothetical protein n=1 Tax=Streptomyces sp. NPDC058947 TaxID=3346675 RepID=UPI0036977301
MTGYTVMYKGERTLVTGEGELGALVAGLALGLGVPAEEARKRGLDASRGAAAGGIHHQWLTEGTWVRIDREWG